MGKSTLLREIFNKTTQGTERQYRWVSAVALEDDDFKASARTLLESLKEIVDPQNLDNSTFESQAARNYGGQYDQGARLDKNSKKQLEDAALGTFAYESFLGSLVFRKPFFAALSPDQRLSVPTSNNVTALNQAPSDVLNVLWRDRKLMKKMQDFIAKHFTTNLTLLDHLHTSLELGLSDGTPPGLAADEGPEAKYQKYERWKSKEFSPINEAGHGIRAMTAILLSLFHPVNRCLFIDEPELHLYPKHKRTLGKQLVKFAKDERKQVFMVTHDATILQGVLDASKDATVYRLSYAQDRKTRHVKQCNLGDARIKFGSTKNQREFLHVLFYERGIIVEGATDRTFYDGVREAATLAEEEDIGLIVAGGKGATLNVAALAHATGVPHIVIYDFDVLLEKDLKVLSSYLEIHSAKPDLSPLVKLIDAAKNAASKTALKDHGCAGDGLSAETRTKLRAEIRSLRANGVWIVEDGAVESWCPSIGKDARFAEQALERLDQKPDEAKPVRAFLTEAIEGLVKQKAGV